MSHAPSVSRRAAIAGAAATLAAAHGAPVFAQSNAMAALAAAAKAEGSVTVDGPPIDTVRAGMVAGFQDAYGIPVSYISSGSTASGARVRAERAAGKYLLDVFISGSDTPTMTFLPSGWLDRVEPILIAPDVVDKSKWKLGRLLYEDDAHTILRVFQYVNAELAVNTQLVKPSEVTAWKSLLDPKWEGKLIIKDPAVAGAGTSLIGYFYHVFGADFVRKLYRDQKPVISRDPRQAAQWLAQGSYPILVGPDPTAVDRFKQLGYPVAPAFPADGPGVLTGGWGLISLMNRAPHPNAAKLFVNWLAGRAALEKFANAALSVSLRNDVKYTNSPAYVFPQNNVKYLDTYDFKYITEQRDYAIAKARELLGE
jgi:iron(III) transport system substrate-binding protein